MNWDIIIPAVCSVSTAVLVAVLNNWSKINKNHTRMKEVLSIVYKLQKAAEDNKCSFQSVQQQMQKLSSAQRTVLQTIILEDCKCIQDAVHQGRTCYEEKLKQLIILYREYFLCGFNSQAKLYFNETIEIVAAHNNILVRELMNQYFSEYCPNPR